MKKITPAQAKALRLYSDGKAHNETALRLHATVYDNLVKQNLIARAYFLNSVITEKGIAALKQYDDNA